MTINLADNSPRISYSVAEGVTQTSFTVPFEFFDNGDLNVYVDGTLKTLTTDYTVSGGSGSTGTVTISVTGASGGSTVVITRDIDIERTTDFPTSGPFQIGALNTELDRLTAIAADLDDRAARALQLTDYDAAANLTLPDVNTRKGKTLAFNATTGAVEAGPSIADTQSVANASADIALLADIQDGTIATNAITNVNTIRTDVTTVSGISGNVTTVANNDANVTTVATNNANITTVAGSITNVNAVGNSIINVNTTASNIADVNTVAGEIGVSGVVTIVANAITDVSTVSGDIAAVITAANDLNEAVSEIDTVANSIANVDTVGTNITNVNTVAGISADVTTVAADGTDIGTVATNISNVNTVAGISANVTTVAGISANVTTVAGIGANVTTVAGDTANIGTIATNLTGTDTIGTVAAGIANINTVATDITNVNSVATNITGVNSFAERYRVGTADPTTDLDAGDLFFNTTSNAYKFYDGSGWQVVNVSGIGSVLDDTTPQLGGDLDTNGKHIKFPDGSITAAPNTNILSFGNSDDMKLWHQGGMNYIQGSQAISIMAADIYLRKGSYSSYETMASFVGDGAVNLYYNNAYRFSTTSTGIDVSGDVTASDDLFVNGGFARISDATTPTLELRNTDTAATDGQELGVIDFYGSDGDYPLPGVKASIKAKAVTDGSYVYANAAYLAFSVSDQSANDKEIFQVTNDYIQLRYGSALTFRNSDNTKVVSIKPSSSQTAHYYLTLPTAGPSAADQILVSDASGNLSFEAKPTGANVATMMAFA